MSDIELLSPLPLRECMERLWEATDRDTFLAKLPVVGRVSDGSISLRKRIWYRNSFQTFLRGKFEEDIAGTLFRGKAGMHPFVKAFMDLMFGMVFLMNAGLLVADVRAVMRGGIRALSPLGLIFPLFLLMIAAFAKFGRYLAREEERFLVSFVARVIEARIGDVPPYDSPASVA